MAFVTYIGSNSHCGVVDEYFKEFVCLGELLEYFEVRFSCIIILRKSIERLSMEQCEW